MHTKLVQKPSKALLAESHMLHTAYLLGSKRIDPVS